MADYSRRSRSLLALLVLLVFLAVTLAQSPGRADDDKPDGKPKVQQQENGESGKRADEKAADEKAADEKAADEKAADEKAADGKDVKPEPDKGPIEVKPDPNLKSLLEGHAPKSLDHLRALQTRLRDLSKRVIPCTVNVQVGAAQGSGIIISEDGYVLTAAHVGGKPNRPVTFVFSDGSTAQGKTLGLNQTLDAGLMKINAKDKKWPHVKMGDSSVLKPGQWCVATGHPGGYERKRKPVVRLGRILSVDEKVIRSDCTLVGGDSGGPLFDLQGRVIGINSRIGTSLTANMHVPVSTYRETWDRLTKGDDWGNPPGVRPYIGVQGSESSDAARVAAVFPGTPAEKAGLKTGDIIVKFGDKEIKTFVELIQLVGEERPGNQVKLRVKRGEKTLNLRLVIGKRGG